jgi:uncharacterized protein (DUF1501 family)
MSKYTDSRRNFLKMAGMVGAGLSTTKTSLFNLNNLNAAVGLNKSNMMAGDYKALICLYLGGGADSFNMIVPKEQSQYDLYAASRSNLALSSDSLLDVNPLNSGGLTYGLHPSMINMQQIFNQGKLAFVNNLGTLVYPTNKQQFYDEAVPLPLGLFSHSDQTNQWQTGISNERQIKGWAGKMSDILYASNNNQNISMNISFNGINTLQSGNRDVVYTIDYGGASGINDYNAEWSIFPARRRALDKMLSHVYQDPFKDTYSKIFKRSLDSSLEFTAAIDSIQDFNTQFTDNWLSNNFKMIAKVIAAREKLGFTRQIFFIDYGGWDMHDELIENQAYTLMEVDNALSEFYTVMNEIDMLDNVVTFSMSEFGRTLTSNGNGTDHAWGGNAFVMGGPVRGNNFYGQYPILELDGNLDVGGGVLIPTTSTDQYIAELALWYGLSPSDLNSVLPNIGNFYTAGSGNPLGFLNI